MLNFKCQMLKHVGGTSGRRRGRRGMVGTDRWGPSVPWRACVWIWHRKSSPETDIAARRPHLFLLPNKGGNWVRF
jgi:hypothetical protein